MTKAKEKSPCDGCIYQPAPGGNYDSVCADCSRFYGDNFEQKPELKDGENDENGN